MPSRNLVHITSPFNADALFCVVVALLVFGTLAFPLETKNGESVNASDNIVGILFLPSIIAASHFCEKSIVAPSDLEIMPMTPHRQSVAGNQDADVEGQHESIYYLPLR